MGQDTSFIGVDPYEVLQVKRSATVDDIRSAHRRLVRSVHPDHGGGKEAFQKVQWAFDLLMNPKLRDQFDRLGVLQGEEAEMQDKVLHAVNSFFDIVLAADDDENTEDVIGKMLSAVVNAMPTLKIEHRKAKKKLKRAKNIMRRLRKRTAGPDLMTNLLERRLGRLEMAVTVAADAIAVNDAMQKFLKDYEYDRSSGFGSMFTPGASLSAPGGKGPGVYLGRRMPDVDDADDE